jgi:hypothetical protein
MPACLPDVRNARKKKWLYEYRVSQDRTEANEAIGANRSTVWRWIKSDPAFAEAVHQIEEEALDEAEGQLMQLVRGGELGAIKFLLKTKGRSRGYGDRLEIAQTTTQLKVDMKRLEVLLANPEARTALEVLATKSLQIKSAAHEG